MASTPYLRALHDLKRISFGGDGPSIWADSPTKRDELVSRLFWDVGSLDFAHLGYEELRTVQSGSAETAMHKEWFIRGGTRVYERSKWDDGDRWKSEEWWS